MKIKFTILYPGMVLPILKCVKGVSKDEITTNLMSMLLELLGIYLILDPIERNVTAYEPNNIKGCEVVPRHNVNLVESRILR